MANFFQNTCKPQGLGGKLMVSMMNSGHTKMAKWGLGYLDIKENDTILDVGCGGGANISYMLKKASKGSVKGIDYSEISVEKSKKVNVDAIKNGRCEIVCGSVMEIPYYEEQFNIVTAFETVYFWQGLEKAFKQVYRVLKVGGVFFICNESNGKKLEDEKWTKVIDGMTIYSAEQLTDYLRVAGFSKVNVQENAKGWICIIAEK